MFPKMPKQEEMGLYQVEREREFRRPKSRLADWGVIIQM